MKTVSLPLEGHRMGNVVYQHLAVSSKSSRAARAHTVNLGTKAQPLLPRTLTTTEWASASRTSHKGDSRITSSPNTYGPQGPTPPRQVMRIRNETPCWGCHPGPGTPPPRCTEPLSFHPRPPPPFNQWKQRRSRNSARHLDSRTEQSVGLRSGAYVDRPQHSERVPMRTRTQAISKARCQSPHSSTDIWALAPGPKSDIGESSPLRHTL